MAFKIGIMFLRWIALILVLLCGICGLLTIWTVGNAIILLGDLRGAIDGALMIGFGMVLATIMFVGIHGILTNSCTYIKIYLVTILVLIVVHIAVVVDINVKRDGLRDLAVDNFNEMFDNRTLKHNYETVEKIQHDLRCCGKQSKLDWEDLMPLSCFNLVSYKAFPNGCAETFADFVEFKNYGTTKLCLTSLLLQVLALISSYFTVIGIRKEKDEDVDVDVDV